MFFDRLQAICESNNTTPTTVAKELGFGNSTATSWKNGAKPSAEAVTKLANYFNVSTDYLLGRTDAPQGFSIVATSLDGTSLSDLTEDELAALEAYLRVYRDGKK
ncbi:helix-turn-helix domain-containing protein [Eubacteriales bacterium OttesenSCG-928-M02]|nr:helix-turn-helix domain-containing protein [Eubacteriales bacterium OttesenSCG-928-M02]